MVHTQGWLQARQAVCIRTKYTPELCYGPPQNVFHTTEKWRVKHKWASISVLVESQHLTTYVTKQKLYFGTFPAAHYRWKPQRSSYSLLGQWALHAKVNMHQHVRHSTEYMSITTATTVTPVLLYFHFVKINWSHIQYNKESLTGLVTFGVGNAF